jgi:hypothetical protein
MHCPTFIINGNIMSLEIKKFKDKYSDDEQFGRMVRKYLELVKENGFPIQSESEFEHPIEKL